MTKLARFVGGQKNIRAFQRGQLCVNEMACQAANNNRLNNHR